MNLLLARTLREKGVMKHLHLALSNEQQVSVSRVSRPQNPIFYMGEGVRPGPFWEVEPDDGERLAAAGYRCIYQPPGTAAGEDD